MGLSNDIVKCPSRGDTQSGLLRISYQKTEKPSTRLKPKVEDVLTDLGKVTMELTRSASAASK